MDIFIQNISKSYGEKQVLSHFSCTIRQGSSQAVMAPSGTGKTTLLRLILGLEQPEEGSISGIPAMLLFKDGKVVGSSVGFKPKPELEAFIGANVP